jgi:hypothetical protein
MMTVPQTLIALVTLHAFVACGQDPSAGLQQTHVVTADAATAAPWSDLESSFSTSPWHEVTDRVDGWAPLSNSTRVLYIDDFVEPPCFARQTELAVARGTEVVLEMMEWQAGFAWKARTDEALGATVDLQYPTCRRTVSVKLPLTNVRLRLDTSSAEVGSTYDIEVVSRRTAAQYGTPNPGADRLHTVRVHVVAKENESADSDWQQAPLQWQKQWELRAFFGLPCDAAVADAAHHLPGPIAGSRP